VKDRVALSSFTSSPVISILNNEERRNKKCMMMLFTTGVYITVSFTLRDNLTRIFSAREADVEEEGAYNENIRRYIGER
jgi:uncharacterized DUF497 family protein